MALSTYQLMKTGVPDITSDTPIKTPHPFEAISDILGYFDVFNVLISYFL
jgi:hypothetical protein